MGNDKVCVAEDCNGPGIHAIIDNNDLEWRAVEGCNLMPTEAMRPYHYECRVPKFWFWQDDAMIWTREVGISTSDFIAMGCDPEGPCTPVPEPSSNILLFSGLCLLILLNYFHKRSRRTSL